MKWFQHDANASTDAKIKKLILRHGAVGYAVYFHCLELIAGDLTQSHITFELEHDSEIIADNLKIVGDNNEGGIDKVNRILKTIIDLGLFQESDNKVFCFKLANRLDNTVSRSPEINKIKDLVSTTNLLRSDYVESTKTYGAEENTIDKNTIQENRLDKSNTVDKPPRATFQNPTLEDVTLYCQERQNTINAEKFISHYEARGWMLGKSKMKDWKACVRTWEGNNFDKPKAIDKQSALMTEAQRLYKKYEAKQ